MSFSLELDIEKNFDLTKSQKMIKKMVRDFAEKEIKPVAKELDEKKQFPRKNVNKLGDMGIMGLPFPEEYGGAGADYLSYVLAVEEVSRACASHGVILSVHVSLGCNPIYDWGTEEQKQKYLVSLAKGEKLGAFGWTEANAGTDASNMKTTAELVDDHYIINGNKMFITNSGEADTFIIFAMTDKSKGIGGISTFIVEADREGFTTGESLDKMGLHASESRELIFQNCRIPRENRLGEEGQAWAIGMGSGINGGRIGIAAQALGIAQRAVDESVNYLEEREQFGRPIGKFQGLRWKIAKMHIKVEAARNLVYKAARLKDAGEDFEKAAAMAKYYSSETAMEVTTEAVQIHGGYGYMKDYPVEKLMRDAKVTQIYEGTSQVQLMVIANKLLEV